MKRGRNPKGIEWYKIENEKNADICGAKNLLLAMIHALDDNEEAKNVIQSSSVTTIKADLRSDWRRDEVEQEDGKAYPPLISIRKPNVNIEIFTL